MRENFLNLENWTQRWSAGSSNIYELEQWLWQRQQELQNKYRLRLAKQHIFTCIMLFCIFCTTPWNFIFFTAFYAGSDKTKHFSLFFEHEHSLAEFISKILPNYSQKTFSRGTCINGSSACLIILSILCRALPCPVSITWSILWWALFNTGEK